MIRTIHEPGFNAANAAVSIESMCLCVLGVSAVIVDENRRDRSFGGTGVSGVEVEYAA